MTNRRLALAGVVAALVGVAVWFVAGKVRSPDKTSATSDAGAMTATASKDLWRVPDRANADPTKDDPTGTIRLEGQVIDDQQQPVAGATVVISSNPVRLATTEGDGSFAFDGLLARTYELSAFHDDAYSQQLTVRVRADTEPVILRMRRGMTVTLTVVDRETRAPIEGATVTLHGMLEQVATTDAAGQTELRGLGSWYGFVLVEADGYGPGTDSYNLPDDPGGRYERTIELGRGAKVSGVVLGPDGNGVPNVSVTAYTQGDRSGGDTETDDAGRWSFPALSAGEWVFSSPGGRLAPGQSAPVRLDGKSPTDGVEIRLTAGASILGLVVDATGAPVPHASIHTTSGESSSATADDHGRFDLYGLPRGRYEVVAREGDRASRPQKVDLRTQETVEIQIAIADATIRGVVVDAAGEPVAEARVSAMPADDYIFENLEGISDSSGGWTIGPLSGDAYYLSAQWPESDPDNELTFDRDGKPTAKPGDRDVKIVLPAAGAVRGTVTLAGAPVQRYALTVSAGRPSIQPQKIISDATGSFTRAGLSPGTYTVAIGGDGFALTTVEDVEIAAGEVKDLGVIAVDPGRTIRGIVVDVAGAPVADADVEIARHFVYASGFEGFDDPEYRTLNGMQRARSGTDGRFTFTGVPSKPERPLKCMAEKRGVGRSQELALPDGDAELTVTIEPTGTIEATVVGLSAGQMDFLMVLATPEGDDLRSSYGSTFAGVSRIEGLRPGSYRVHARMMEPQRTSDTVTVEVKGGETVTTTLTFPTGGVTVVLEPGGECRYLILNRGEETNPSLDATVAYESCKGTDPIELDDIPAGDYRVCSGWKQCTPISVKPTPDRQTFKIP